MKFNTMIDSLATNLDLKRSAKAYVFDYRNLRINELKSLIIKTAPQYFHKHNVLEALEKCKIHDNSNVRALYKIILKDILLNKDEFMLDNRSLNESIIKYEQDVINTANEYALHNQNSKKESLEFFTFVLETAWENYSISHDEKNLILKIKDKLSITDKEYRIIAAKVGIFPKAQNVLHTNDEINIVKRELGSLGLLFTIRDTDGQDYDIIPEEIVETLREIFNVEIKQSSYIELLKNKYVRKKEYLTYILEKGNIDIPKYPSSEELKMLVIEHIKPSVLLNGYNTKDGVNVQDLVVWCKELELPCSGQKIDLINRILKYYDDKHEKIENVEDERILYFKYYEDLAGRNLSFLRKQNVIKKDIECERKFEKATDYLFEFLLNQKPLKLAGTDHPDGMLSFKNKIIQWDNKSKESQVHLSDHMKQFNRYILQSEKDGKEVAVFAVIAPDFTKESVKIAMEYQLLNDTIITLIKASDLKQLAKKWDKFKNGEPFPLGYFKQPGLFKLENISFK